MTSKKHRMIVYGLAIHLVLVAIICYAAFPVTAPPDNPIRKIYYTNAGKVLFDHRAHNADTGFGIACMDCHHHPQDDDAALVACSSCHTADVKEGQVPDSCLDCHDADEVSDAEYPNTSDAFHQQCIGCHEEFEKGPQPGSENCSQCHVLG